MSQPWLGLATMGFPAERAGYGQQPLEYEHFALGPFCAIST